MLRATQNNHIENSWFKNGAETKQYSASSNNEAKVVELASGTQIFAREYNNFNVYVVSGEAELVRRGMVNQILISNGQWNEKETIFDNCEGDAYIRATTNGQLLVLPKVRNNTIQFHSNMVKSERLFTQDTNKKNAVNNAENLSKNTIEVSIYDLDKAYEDTVIISPKASAEIKKNIYLNASLQSEDKPKKYLTFISLGKLIAKQIKKVAVMTNNAKKVIAGKLLSVLDHLGQKMDNNLKVAAATEVEKCNKHGTFDFIGKWKAVDYLLPNKNGLYYVSNGKDISVEYFNKNSNKFHNENKKIKIKFWSSSKVNLKD